MAIRLNANHLAQGGPRGEYEPQRANNGILVVYGLPEWTDDGQITLSLESFPIPKENNAQIEARYFNERRKFAGPANVEDMEVVVKDTVDRDVARVLLAWRRLVYNPYEINKFEGIRGGISDPFPEAEGAVGLAKNYKKSGEVILVAPDGSHVRRWAVQGLWPMSMDPGDIDMTSEDFIRITLTLSVDRIFSASLKTASTD